MIDVRSIEFLSQVDLDGIDNGKPDSGAPTLHKGGECPIPDGRKFSIWKPYTFNRDGECAVDAYWVGYEKADKVDWSQPVIFRLRGEAVKMRERKRLANIAKIGGIQASKDWPMIPVNLSGLPEKVAWHVQAKGYSTMGEVANAIKKGVFSAKMSENYSWGRNGFGKRSLMAVYKWISEMSGEAIHLRETAEKTQPDVAMLEAKILRIQRQIEGLELKKAALTAILALTQKEPSAKTQERK